MQTPWVRRAIFACAMTTLLALGGVAVAAQTPTAAPVTGGATFTGKITKTSPLAVNGSLWIREGDAEPRPNKRHSVTLWGTAGVYVLQQMPPCYR